MACSPSKAVLAALSILFWLMAGALITIGVWVFIGYQNVETVADSAYVLVPSAIIMGVGIFLFLLGIVGCVGAFKEQKCLLGFYFMLLLLIFLGMCAAGILAYIHRGDVSDTLKRGLQKGLDEYGNNTELTHEIDYIQETLHCCGVESYHDWNTTAWYSTSHPYPESCCKNHSCTYQAGNDTSLYTEGCHKKLEDGFKKYLGIIAGVAVAFVVVQLLGMICSCVLICRRKSEVPYIGLADPQGMRV